MAMLIIPLCTSAQYFTVGGIAYSVLSPTDHTVEVTYKNSYYHGNRYGWGWSLLTTPESLYGRGACSCPHTPDESHQLLMEHFRSILPQASAKQLDKLIG